MEHSPPGANDKQQVSRSFVEAMTIVHGHLNGVVDCCLAEKAREIIIALGWKDWWKD